MMKSAIRHRIVFTNQNTGPVGADSGGADAPQCAPDGDELIGGAKEGVGMSTGREAVEGRPRTVMAVTSREEMAVLLVRRNRFLREYARRRLPAGAIEDVVEETVERAAEWLLAIEHPSTPDGEGYARAAVRRECQRTARSIALAKKKEPIDPVLGRLKEPAVRRALRLLRPDQRNIILAIDRGEATPAQIAEAEGTRPAAVRQKLHYARHRALKLMRDAGHAAPGVLVLAPRRVRSSLVRLVDVSVPQSAAAMWMVPLVALFSPTAPALVTSPALAVAAPREVRQATGPTVVSPLAHTEPPSLVGRVVVAKATPTTPPTAPAVHGAAAETPEDVRITAAAVPPRSDGEPAVVAIGKGQTCQCLVLLQSPDGGVSWTATGGTAADGTPPSDLTQLVLPPAYPADPRIFGGTDAFTGLPPYVATAFGAPFKRITSFAGHAGQVAVSASFDDGDPRVFVAAATGIWSLNLGVPGVVGSPHLEVQYTSAITGAVAALATPPTLGAGPAVLAWVPTLAAVQGAATPPRATATLMSCSSSAPCAVLADLPVPPAQLSVGRDAAGTVVAYIPGTAVVYVSQDGGHSFASVALPEGVLAFSVAIMGRTGNLWASTMHGQTLQVLRYAADGMWADVTRGAAPLEEHTGTLVAVDGSRVLDALSGAGYRCTTASGVAWSPRCPSG